MSKKCACGARSWEFVYETRSTRCRLCGAEHGWGSLTVGDPASAKRKPEGKLPS